MIHDKNLKSFEIINGYCTFGGKKYSDCNIEAKVIFNKIFKYLKSTKWHKSNKQNSITFTKNQQKKLSK